MAIDWEADRDEAADQKRRWKREESLLRRAEGDPEGFTSQADLDGLAADCERHSDEQWRRILAGRRRP